MITSMFAKGSTSFQTAFSLRRGACRQSSRADPRRTPADSGRRGTPVRRSLSLGIVFRHERGQPADGIGQAGKGKPDAGRLWKAGRQFAKHALGFGKGRLRLGRGLPVNLPGQRIPVVALEGRRPLFWQVLCTPAADGADGNAGAPRTPRLCRAASRRRSSSAGRGWLLKAHSVFFSTSSTADRRCKPPHFGVLHAKRVKSCEQALPPALTDAREAGAQPRDTSARAHVDIAEHGVQRCQRCGRQHLRWTSFLRLDRGTLFLAIFRPCPCVPGMFRQDVRSGSGSCLASPSWLSSASSSYQSSSSPSPTNWLSPSLP